MIPPLDNHDLIINTTAKRMALEPRLHPIPSNMIFDKTLPGWGATYGEIKADRNSIILLPHKAQIYSKNTDHCEEHNTFAVTEKATVSKILTYIRNSGNKNLKFLSTPEGLFKILKTYRVLKRNPYTDFFILIDECHKLTRDVGFRGSISIAMNDFFMFEGKAMISATPFKPSDPRFHDFLFVKVKHERNIKKEIHLLYVNNIGAAVKQYLKEYTGERLFIFFNSLNGIHALVENLGLQDRCHIYCSEDGVKDFKLKGINYAYSNIDCENLAELNLATSSFYNGLDIKAQNIVPDVLILTDIKYADHTIIDPSIDTFQILGRFRSLDYDIDPSDRYRTATHIINIKHKALVKLEEQAIKEAEISKVRYEMLLQMQATATDPFFSREVYGEALQRCYPYSNMLNEHGDFDWFRYDHYLYEHRLKMCYGDELTPGLTYIMSNLYNITEQRKMYEDEEFEKMGKGINRYSVESIRYACEMLIEIEKNQGVDGVEQFYEELKRRFPLVVRAVSVLGYQRLEDLKFRSGAIQRELLKQDIISKRVHHGMIDLVYKSFMVGVSYPVSKVKQKLQALFDEFGIEAKAKSTDITTYFKVSEYTGHKVVKNTEQSEEVTEEAFEVEGNLCKSVRMYYLMERKHNKINLNSRKSAQF